MRVALHRLKSDGWILTRRVGRSSAYRLHPDRLVETRKASDRIYAASAPEASAWHICLLPPGGADDVLPGDALLIAPRVILRPGGRWADCPPYAPDGLTLAVQGPIPAWLRDQIATPELRAAYSALQTCLAQAEELTRTLPPGSTRGSTEAIALRVLAVHAWRRVILRHPDLPDALYGEDWPGPACRALLHSLLARFPRPDAEALATL